nr:unnamed protein product [Digitaria exilis]
MDEDFCFDVQMMVMMSTVLLGGAGYLAYLLGLAERSDRKGSIVVISVFLGVWVVLGAYIFLSYLIDFLPLPETGLQSLAPHLGSLRRCLRGVAWLFRLPVRCVRARLRRRCATAGGDDAAQTLPQFMAPGEGRGMAALARELPVRGGVVAVDGIAAYGEKRDVAAPECSVCLCEVETEVTAKG